MKQNIINVTISRTTPAESGVFVYKDRFGSYLSFDLEKIDVFYTMQEVLVNVNSVGVTGQTEFKMYGGEHLTGLIFVIADMICYEFYKGLSKDVTHNEYDLTLKLLSTHFNAYNYEGYIIGEIMKTCNSYKSFNITMPEFSGVVYLLKHCLNLTSIKDIESSNKFVHKTMRMKMRNELDMTPSDVITALFTMDMVLVEHVVKYQLSRCKYRMH